jgi:hypothetical protein
MINRESIDAESMAISGSCSSGYLSGSCGTMERGSWLLTSRGSFSAGAEWMLRVPEGSSLKFLELALAFDPAIGQILLQIFARYPAKVKLTSRSGSRKESSVH